MKNLILSSALALIAVPAGYAQEAVQWRVEDGGNGHWYQRIGTLMSFTDAQGVATVRGAHLATCSDVKEWVKVLAVAAAAPKQELYFWIGLYQDDSAPDYAEPAGGWRWVDGTQLDFSIWLPNEPNNTNGIEDFGHGFVSASGESGWNDTVSGSSLVSVFEWSADCNSDGIVDFGQIRSGILVDDDLNNVPDCCELGTSCTPCPGDITKGGSVDATDLSIILAAWGSNGQGEFQADIDGSGLVDGGDLALVLDGWGPCNAPAWATVISWMPDSSIVTDPQLRASITATGQPWRVRDTATGIEMLLVPPGSFQMGCLVGSDAYACTNGELPVHQVTLTQAFYLGRFEVTQAQWQTSMGSNPSFF